MTKNKNGKNIPHLTWESLELSEQNEEKISLIRQKLFSKRNERIRPYKDDKILTDWNGLMIASLAKAARILKYNHFLEAAKKSVDFILTTLSIKYFPLH